MNQTIRGPLASWPARLAGFALVATTLGAVCGERGADGTVRHLTADGAVVTDSTEAYRGLDYPLDGEKYRKWVVAQRSLDAIPDFTIPTRVSLRNFTEDDVDATADWLERDDRARVALESADLSAKDFVRTSVALEQLVASMAVNPVRFRDLPAGNAEIVTRDPGFRRTFDARRVRVVGDDSDSDDDGDGVAERRVRGDDSDAGDSDGNGKGRGKHKGKGRGQGKH